MSDDLRSRLAQAVVEPAEPIDIDAIYRRGRRQRRLQAAVAVAAVLALIAGGAALLPDSPSGPPVIGDGDAPALDDDHLSWREYRDAVAATADCLDEADAARAHRFDEDKGRFVFEAEGTNAYDACYRGHLAAVQQAWIARTQGPDAEIDWDTYRAAHQDLWACMEDAGLIPVPDFDYTNGVYPNAFGVEPDARMEEGAAERRMSECRQQTLTGLGHDWEQLMASTREENEERDQDLATCLEGHREASEEPSGSEPPCFDLVSARDAYPGRETTEEFLQAFSDARARWTDAGIRDYTMTVRVPSTDIVESVTVEDGEVVAGDQRYAVGSLFAAIQDEVDSGLHVEGTFDPETGRPNEVRITRDEASPTGSYRLIVEDFRTGAIENRG